MHQSRNWFRGVLVFLLMLLGVNGSAIPTPSASGAMLPQSTQSSRISRYLKDLAREFSVEHLVRRKHTVPHFGEVTTTISVAPDSTAAANAISMRVSPRTLTAVRLEFASRWG